MTRDPGQATTKHLLNLHRALDHVTHELPRIESWGRALAGVLVGGGRLLAAGNGGSAAQAQHLCAELVGRFVNERRPLSAICLSSETSSLTAIANDYGAEEVFARQVEAHGRAGDVLVALSTSGRSPNVLNAARAARACGLTTWAVTGPAPNPLEAIADDAISIPAVATATVQEVHLVAIHLVCTALEASIASGPRTSGRPSFQPFTPEARPWAASS